MYILYFLAPETHLDVIKNAIFAVGAGSIGHYSHCAWQTLGEGQFIRHGVKPRPSGRG